MAASQCGSTSFNFDCVREGIFQVDFLEYKILELDGNLALVS